MHYIRTATAADVLDTLKEYRDGLLPPPNCIKPHGR